MIRGLSPGVNALALTHQLPTFALALALAAGSIHCNADCNGIAEDETTSIFWAQHSMTYRRLYVIARTDFAHCQDGLQASCRAGVGVHAFVAKFGSLSNKLIRSVSGASW